MFFITALLLYLTEDTKSNIKTVSLKMHCIGSNPGNCYFTRISRSGSTISMALILGIHKESCSIFIFNGTPSNIWKYF